MTSPTKENISPNFQPFSGVVVAGGLKNRRRTITTPKPIKELAVCIHAR